jgi:hypothetical protein
LGVGVKIELGLNIISAIPPYLKGGSAGLAQNEDSVATQVRGQEEVARRIADDLIEVEYRLEVDATRTVRAQNRWNGVDAFG